ncbi:hypothetical protein G6F47_012886 [Rhizopus delemar]|nr:hypothetical protein G6F54_013114 [Rhizopus delemar]KAG1489852.1 hypothetical protein G6F53_013348 [Rhizopus delemar]KAG1578559.1 hypothetical protein G6F47_012886 [Rhizopus delemar]
MGHKRCRKKKIRFVRTVLVATVYVEDNSDDDFQPIVTARKRKSRKNTSQSGSQKKPKGKGKATDSEVTTTSSTGISTTDEPTVFNKVTLENYDLEYSSDDFDAPVTKRPFLGESTKGSMKDLPSIYYIYIYKFRVRSLV